MIYLLGIDAGTTAFKGVLFNQQGIVVAKAQYSYNLEYISGDQVELNPEEYWKACVSIIKTILATWKGRIEDIKALAISSQGETMIPLDRLGNPLRPAIVWLDNRSVAEANEIKSEFTREYTFKITGQPDIVPTWPAAKILWISKNQKEIFRKIYKFLLLEDYLIFRLTNKTIAEGSLLSSSLMFDINTGGWWQDMLDFIKISSGQLPEIWDSGKAIGEISDKASKETGLSKDTIVVSGAFDHAASMIGAGNIKTGIITESTGCTLAIGVNTSKPVFDPELRIPCQYHAIKGRYFLLPWCQTAGMVYKWFQNEFYKKDFNNKDLDEAKLFELMDREALEVPPGSDGLIMLPHLAGAFTPESNPYARGVFFGISLKTSRAHFERSILESVAFMLKRNLDLLQALGIDINEIRSLGGGARSLLWNKIKADVCQKTVMTMQVSETASLGAAILAGYALNIFHDLEEATTKMVHPDKKIEPNNLNADVYSRAYEKYIKLYDLLLPLF